MKCSDYNVEVQSSVGFLLYNCIRNGLALLDNDTLPKYKKLIQDPTEADSDPLYEELLRGGCLIDSKISEFELLKAFSRYMRFAPSKVTSITIAPTSFCNLKCTYCYEEKKHFDNMDSNTGKAAGNFIKDLLKEYTQACQITWFGGEPLLAIDTIEKVTEDLRNYCIEKKIRYNANIVTNGVLLTREVAVQLKEYGITGCQITLDGDRETHDARRPQKNGKGTFDKIIENIVEVHDLLKVNIRVNLDKSNCSAAFRILEIVEQHGLKNKVNFYFAAVNSNTDACCNLAPLCFSPHEFATLEVELLQLATERGFKINKYPRFKPFACGAINSNNFLIGPTGEVWKCWHTLGQTEEAIGNVFEPLKFNHVWAKWISWEAYDLDECRKCKVLPLCSGGCPWQWMRYLDNPDMNQIPCWSFRYNLPKLLELKAKQELQEKGVVLPFSKVSG
ncbi:hypothetical protein SY88_18605 [Clostridiales bacterium PH28_bin88]|nr:hypothetical protein SY88_18605 [Clostridiales bacterium PH28_bin88]